MKVNKTSITSFVNPYQSKNRSLPQQAEGQKKKDQVQISHQAKAMLEENKYTTDPARQEKIDSVKHQIKTGEYQVDHRKVAEKMYDFWFKK